MVPFVSRRSTGIVCGLVSAGGASGGVINQALFFLNTPAHGAYGARTPGPSPSPMPYYAYCIPCGVVDQALNFSPLHPRRQPCAHPWTLPVTMFHVMPCACIDRYGVCLLASIACSHMH